MEENVIQGEIVEETAPEMVQVTKEDLKKLQKEKEAEKEKKKLAQYHRTQEICRVLSDPSLCVVEPFRKKPPDSTFHFYYDTKLDKRPIIIEEKDGLCQKVSPEYVAEKLIRYIDSFKEKETYQFYNGKKKIVDTIDQWVCMTAPLKEAPQPMVLKSDPRKAFWRLPWDIDPTEKPKEELYSDWIEIFERMSDPQAFYLRHASITDPNADRKQAVYISGPKDSGKSQIMAVYAWYAGAHTPGQGSYATLSNDDLEDKYYKGALKNKRLCCIGEASPLFLNQEAFKCITGDSMHNINVKWGAMHTAELYCLLYFFSNNPPAIRSEDALIERIIDIRISPVKLSREKLIRDKEYQARLIKQLRFMTQFAMHEYNRLNLSGKRIPCTNEFLPDTIDEKESEYIELFTSMFIVDKSAVTEGTVVTDYFEKKGIRDTNTRRRIKEQWMRKFGVTYKQMPYDTKAGGIRYVWSYVGMRRATQEELQFTLNSNVIKFKNG